MAETCRDRFRDAYPTLSPVRAGKCPSWYGWLEDPEWCLNGAIEDQEHRCSKCWDREIPIFIIPEEKEKNMTANKVDFKCCNCAHFTVCSLKEELINAQTAVDRVQVPRDDHSYIALNQIKWIEPVKLDCVHFLSIPANIRTDYNLCGTSVSNSDINKAVY